MDLMTLSSSIVCHLGDDSSSGPITLYTLFPTLLTGSCTGTGRYYCSSHRLIRTRIILLRKENKSVSVWQSDVAYDIFAHLAREAGETQAEQRSIFRTSPLGYPVPVKMSSFPPSTIPLTRSPNTAGPPTTIKYTHAAPHPVQQLEVGRVEGDQRAKRALQAATYGSAFPMRQMMKESVLCQFHRLPGLPSSGLALEGIRRQNEDLDFADYLNLPSESPEGGFSGDGCGLGSGHEAMEKKLGIAPTAPF